MVSIATIHAAQNGDSRAFTELVEAYASVVCAIATAVTGDPRSGEDVGQQVFLTAWQKLPTLRNAASFGPWLRQLTRHRARDHVRRGRARPDVLPADPQALDRASDPLDDIEERLDAHRAEDAVWQCLETLDVDHREVLVLYYREGQRLKQVAELLELSEATARKRLSRARGHLREAVEARLADGLRRTAPGAGFASGVAALVASASPGLAKAGTGTLAAGSLPVLSAGAFLGATAGLAGVWLGYRKGGESLDEGGRTRLRRHAIAQGAAVLVAVALMVLWPGLTGPLVGMTLLVAVLGATVVRWPASRGRTFGTAAGVTLGTLGASLGLSGSGLDLATALALHLQLYAFLALPLVLASAATWHLRLRWRVWFAGMASWVAAAPVLVAGPAVAAALLGASPLAGAVGLSFAAGFGEELARLALLAALWRLRGPLSGRHAVLLGLGHGGIEAMLFGLGAPAMLSQGPPMDAWAHALFGVSRVLLLLGHVGFALLVWRAVRNRAPLWLVAAIAAHTALDLAAFAGPAIWPRAGMVLGGAAVVGWAGTSAWLVRSALVGGRPSR